MVFLRKSDFGNNLPTSLPQETPMATTTRRSCISDRPLLSLDHDTLDNNTYAEGLFDFILHAEMPITIGMQGGWGSGKTSLINMLQSRLRENEEDSTICVVINAWEHSLLQTQGSKAEVTLSLLRGILDDLQTTVKNTQNIPGDVKKQVVDDDGLLGKAKKAALGLTFLGMRAALMMGTGIDVQKTKDAPQETPPMAKVVRELRNNLTQAVNTIAKDSNSPNRFVFFIDDLDRVPPETAVEILDVTKNIFDIPHCVFVLAVDYEVVVKGLEGKFGKKTEENEREFRQYFDKIIQVPFTMPVGAYDRQMDKLLENCFSSLGYEFDAAAGADILENIRSATMAATDGIPRSVKRIVNTVSLLQRVSGGKRERDDGKIRPNDFEIRFIVVALHINFPELCRRVMEMPAFTGWKVEQLGERWKLSTEGVDSNKLKEVYGASFDEPWEQVVYCLCRKNQWLKTRAVAASTIMNCLRAALRRNRSQDQKDNTLTEEEKELLEDVLSDIRVVSVEDVPAVPVDNSKAKTDQITVFCRNLHRVLIGKIGGLEPLVERKHYATGRVKSERTYSVEIKNSLVEKLAFVWEAEKTTFYISYFVQEPQRNKKQFKDSLKITCEYKDIYVYNNECYKSFESFTY
jgi:hypothetical protein